MPLNVINVGCLDDTITLEHGFRGQLKFCDSHYWGAVCSLDKHNEEFIQVNSQVVCYELGYSGDGTDFTTGSNPENYFVLVKVHCQGDEERLSECHKEEITPKEIIKCKHTHESVYVTCPSESHAVLRNFYLFMCSWCVEEDRWIKRKSGLLSAL